MGTVARTTSTTIGTGLSGTTANTATTDHAVSLGAHEQYLREVKRLTPMTGEEEAALFWRLARGKAEAAKQAPDPRVIADAQRARTRLVEGYQPLVIGLATRFTGRSMDMTLLDFVQEGNVGLLEALDRHNGRRSAGDERSAFGAWVFPWIRARMVRACWLRPGGVRIPPSQARALRRLAIAQGALFSALGRDPKTVELADYLNLPHQTVNELLRVQALQVSPLHSLPRDDDGSIAEEQWPVIGTQVPQDVPDEQRSPLMQALERALDYLPTRERIVVQLRYGFLDGASRTCAEAAADLGVSSAVIEELDRRARLHLRKVLAPYASSNSHKAPSGALSA